MAAPTAPTLTSIVTEGLKKAGYASPSTAMISRASGEWMEEIKADIALVNKRLKTLQASASGTTTVSGSSTYALASDFGEELAIRFADLVDPLCLVTADELNQQRETPSYGQPEMYQIRYVSGTPYIEFFPCPNAAYTWSYDYYADITLIDMSSTILATTLRKWRNLYVQGIKAKCLEWQDDNRASPELATYWNLLKSVTGREDANLTFDMQCVAGDYS